MILSRHLSSKYHNEDCGSKWLAPKLVILTRCAIELGLLIVSQLPV